MVSSGAPMGAAGAVPVDGAACRDAWQHLRKGAREGTCCCFQELLERKEGQDSGTSKKCRSKLHKDSPRCYSECGPQIYGTQEYTISDETTGTVHYPVSDIGQYQMLQKKEQEPHMDSCGIASI
ncbi:hypothetical protein UY3_06394 [Chelonia mydas]|uniref:Uncharacterized protein n=1 Tax=Chelonia mydas TaxID=8469 RepID=M7C773_CHEMY|nr:hypothetical protein UY3_06394 [Chelonia mydas]